ncbi:MAG: hypothetical protein MUE72_00855 [Chitinophagaceae bacterium]|jgi:hypothetical protein|nr:hypothetical protein [Chitinophagaceae bacterium]
MKIAIAILLLTGIMVSYTNHLQHTKYSFIHHRKTIDTIVQQIGIVYKTGTIDEPIYVLRCNGLYLNLFPANLSQTFQHNQLKVVFSGAMKAMHPMEDEYGQFFVITEMHKQ